MKTFLIISFLTLVFGLRFMFKPITELSYNLQKICNEHSPKQLHQSETISALVCGSKLKPNSELKKQMIQSQLIHIIIVSGSHILVLEKILSFCSTPIWFIDFLLVLYGLLTGFQPPAIRAITVHFLKKINEHFSWNLTIIQLQIFTTIFLLILIPSWITSYSFILSSLAASALCLPIFIFKKKLNKIMRWSYQIQKTFFVHLSVSLVMTGFSVLGFLANILFAGIIGGLLFPSALMIFISHNLSYVLDNLVSYYIDFSWPLPCSLQNSLAWLLSDKLTHYLGVIFDFVMNSLQTTLTNYVFNWPLPQNPMFLSKPASYFWFWTGFLVILTFIQQIQIWNFSWFFFLRKPRLGKFTVFKSAKDL